MNSNKKLLSVIGPTAIGKTRLAIQLAQHLNTEIISCDSRQFYKEMKIGTASPSEEELGAAVHHFIGNLNITHEYSVGDFEKEALRKLFELFQMHDVVIMVGGSGLYEKAINEGLDHFPAANPEIKRALIKEFEQKGIETLQSQLKELDPEYYATVDLHNPVRIIRALEVSISTKKPYSSFKQKNTKKRNFSTIKIGLEAPRGIIYERIDKRVDLMMEQGLLQEVNSLLPYKNKNALQTVGYKELFEYLEGKYTLNEAVEEIKKNSRRYAKRQLTWYRKDSSVYWFNYADVQPILDFVDKKI